MEWNIVRLNSVDSTNKYTSELLRQNDIKEGTIVITGNQVQGKGQQNKTWDSSPGMNLTFSLLLKPAFLSADKAFFLSECVAVALIKALASYGIPSKVKWPNDIFADDRKIAGILIENTFLGGQIKHSIVGIGVNINQVSFNEYPYPAGSVKLLLGRDVDMQRFLETLLGKIAEGYESLKDDGSAIHASFIGALYGLGKKQPFSFEGQDFEGEIKGVQPDGQLVVLTNEGEKTFYSGSLKFKKIFAEGSLPAN